MVKSWNFQGGGGIHKIKKLLCIQLLMVDTQFLPFYLRLCRRSVHPGRSLEYKEERKIYKASTAIVSHSL